MAIKKSLIRPDLIGSNTNDMVSQSYMKVHAPGTQKCHVPLAHTMSHAHGTFCCLHNCSPCEQSSQTADLLGFSGMSRATSPCLGVAVLLGGVSFLKSWHPTIVPHGNTLDHVLIYHRPQCSLMVTWAESSLSYIDIVCTDNANG